VPGLTNQTFSMIGIDLFSGAGGMSVGAISAGIDVRVAVEADPHAAITYRENHTSTCLLDQRIEAVQDVPLGRRDRKIILFGGPPCQGFSTSNQRTRNSDNPSNWLFREYMRLVRMIQPEWVVFENVRGILETERGVFFQKTLRALQQLGYTTSHWLLNALNYGVPQRRFRLFIIGSLQGISVPEPPQVSGQPATVYDAIGDLPILRNGAMIDDLPYRCAAKSQYAKALRGRLKSCGNHLITQNHPGIIARYRHLPQGGNWSSIPASLMANYKDRERCHTGIYRRLNANEPSIVIGNFRKNMLIHPTQHRGLSVREAARLQSFPDSFRFCGSVGFQQQQVGNAVPPMLAHAVFHAVVDVERGTTMCR